MYVHRQHLPLGSLLKSLWYYANELVSVVHITLTLEIPRRSRSLQSVLRGALAGAGSKLREGEERVCQSVRVVEAALLEKDAALLREQHARSKQQKTQKNTFKYRIVHIYIYIYSIIYSIIYS